jgi:asparagine synthase (glutamine-hydrolysing)
MAGIQLRDFGNHKKVCINLARDKGMRWFHYSEQNLDLWVKGFAFIDDEFSKGIDLAKRIRTVSKDREETIKLIENASGNFAVVVLSERFVLAAVDLVRSIPLYYGVCNGRLFLSDSPEWIKSEMGGSASDYWAGVEFILTGYVTGEDTLFRNIKQIQAGELILLEGREEDIEPRSIRYQWDCTGEECHSPGQGLLDQMDGIVRKTFLRLLRSTEGKTLVVPLSAGHDSHLVIHMLRELGAKDVICFSYGRKGNHESEISRQRARSLGYRWEFIPYTRRKWANWIQSDRWREYCAYAHNFTSLPHLQDWPAVLELKRRGLIRERSVFVPGHTVTLVSPFSLFTDAQQGSLDQLIKGILEKHYSLWDWSLKRDSLTPWLRERILRTINTTNIHTFEEMVCACELWESQERQAKFTLNSVRVYEFFGFEWRLPLWDKELVDFWRKVPFSLRHSKRLLMELVQGKCEEHSVPRRSQGCEKRARIRRSVKKILGSNSILFYLLNKFDIRPSGILSYWLNPLGFYGIAGLLEFLKTYHYTLNVNSLLVKQLYVDRHDHSLPREVTEFFHRGPYEEK